MSSLQYWPPLLCSIISYYVQHATATSTVFQIEAFFLYISFFVFIFTYFRAILQAHNGSIVYFVVDCCEWWQSIISWRSTDSCGYCFGQLLSVRLFFSCYYYLTLCLLSLQLSSSSLVVSIVFSFLFFLHYLTTQYFFVLNLRDEHW